jgi:uncharacterized phage protein gp47/JayE
MLTIPTVQELRSQIISSYEAALNITIPTFGKSYLRTKATVKAGVLWLLYLTAAKVEKNMFVDTCDEPTLRRFGLVKINRDRFAATQAQYSILVTGTNSAIIPAGTVFKSNDNALNPSKRYVLDTPFTLDGTNLITVRALESGVSSSLLDGDQLSLEAPIALVDTIATVDNEVIQPQEAETVDAYRQVIILSFRLEPQGGAPADYRLWSLEVQGIVNAYPYASNNNPNFVDLYLESDESDGIPTPTDLANVEESIELPTVDRPSRKPINVTVNYLPIEPKEVNVTINGMGVVSVENQDLIYGAIESKIDKIRPFVDAIDVFSDRNDNLNVNTIISTILEVLPGSQFGSIVIEVDGPQTPSYTFEFGEIPKLNTITYA